MSLALRVRGELLLAAFALATGCAAPTEAPPVEVMSFNVRYANPNDGADAWTQRRELVFDVLRDHDPDLVGLQEALPAQMDELAAAFPAHRFLGQGREGGRRGEFSALMVRDARFEVLESGDVWLSPTPDVVGSRGWDAALPRMCTWAVLRDRASGAQLFAMNAHFDHRGQEARRESAGVLLAERARRPDLPLILTGDLNAGEDAPPLDALRAGGLRDSFRDAHPDAATVGTFNGFRGEAEGAKIDYVLVDERWTTLAAAIVRDHDGERYPSDHFPVTATLRLRGRGRRTPLTRRTAPARGRAPRGPRRPAPGCSPRA